MTILQFDWGAVEAGTNFVQRVQHERTSNEPAFQFSLAGEIAQNDTDENCDKPLSRCNYHHQTGNQGDYTNDIFQNSQRNSDNRVLCTIYMDIVLEIIGREGNDECCKTYESANCRQSGENCNPEPVFQNPTNDKINYSQ